MRLELVLVAVLGTALAFARASEGAETRAWTSASGATIDAAFVQLVGDTVELEKAAGGRVRIRLSQLSPSDQAWVRSQTQQAMTGRAAQPEKAAPSVWSDWLGRSLTDAKRKDAAADGLADKDCVGLYFSAHWCPPCRQFTPKLVQAYNEMKADGKKFEIVFVSSDYDEKAMFDYMKEAEMPWLGMKYSAKRREALQERFRVSGIPKLVILDAKGNVISENGRGEVTSSGKNAFAGWVKN